MSPGKSFYFVNLSLHIARMGVLMPMSWGCCRNKGNSTCKVLNVPTGLVGKEGLESGLEASLPPSLKLPLSSFITFRALVHTIALSSSLILSNSCWAFWFVCKYHFFTRASPKLLPPKLYRLGAIYLPL